MKQIERQAELNYCPNCGNPVYSSASICHCNSCGATSEVWFDRDTLVELQENEPDFDTEDLENEM